MIWIKRVDGIQSHQINGIYYVRKYKNPNTWFAEICGEFQQDILICDATEDECINACKNHLVKLLTRELEGLKKDEHYICRG